jgi:hypothetical protein
MLVVSPLSRVGDGGSSGNLVLPVDIDQNTMPGKIETRILGISIGLRRSAYSLSFLAAKQLRLSSVESTWEVESEIYADEFSVCTGWTTAFRMFNYQF